MNGLRAQNRGCNSVTDRRVLSFMRRQNRSGHLRGDSLETGAAKGSDSSPSTALLMQCQCSVHEFYLHVWGYTTTSLR